jgi:hypothetical protein
VQNALFSALSLLLVLAAGSPARVQTTAASPGFTIPVDSAWSVHDLVTQYAELTGSSVSFTEQGQDVARKTQLVLDAPLAVGPANVHAVVESLLLRYDFVVTELRTAGPRMLAVDALSGGNRSSLHRKALFVPAAELDAFAERAATLVQTIVHLEALDALQVSSTLRSILDDGTFERAIPVGNGRSVILTGHGAQIARVARMLREADAELSKVREESK